MSKIWKTHRPPIFLGVSRNRQILKFRIRRSWIEMSNSLTNMTMNSNPPFNPIISKNSIRNYYLRKSIIVKSSMEITISIRIMGQRIRTFIIGRRFIHHRFLCAQAPTLLSIIRLMKKFTSLTNYWTQKWRIRLCNNIIWIYSQKRAIRSQLVVTLKSVMALFRDIMTQILTKLYCCSI